MTFENFIPARSKNVLELIGDAPPDFETSEEKFLEIQPDCSYIVAEDLSKIDGTFDAILVQSPLIGTLSNKKLVALMKKIAKLLKDDGTIIFTLDNMGHADNLTAILEGKPLKFKVTNTRSEVQDAMEDAGLTSLRSLNAGRGIKVSRQIAELAKTDLSVFVYILTACKKEPPPKTLIQTLIGESTVCAPSRVHMPNAFFMTERNIYIVSSPVGKPYKLFDQEQFDRRIFINQRMCFPSFAVGLDFFNVLREKEILFISEMDDHPVLWEDDYQKTAWINFRAVHAVQTSTPYLADFLRQFNPHVTVFANQLRRLPPPRDFDAEFKQKKPVTIFFGALNRDGDFIELLPMLNRVARQYGKKVAFKILSRRNLFDALESDNKIFVGDMEKYEGQFIPYDEYEEAIRSSDIALLPLRDNEFNRSKSDLKFIECAGSGAVVLASPVVYSNSIEEGKTGFIYRDEREFVNKLNLLIKNRNLRRMVAEKAYNYVRHERLMSQHYEERLDWYRDLLQRMPELTAEAQKRIEKFIPQFKDEIDKFRARFTPQNSPPTFAPVERNSNRNAEIIIPE
ncbi:MAG: glycosyltransferase [Selenomonadaceae bacterium]|nr:glycosyltransferase [Selenomonadaceae bacterium]